MQSRFGWTSESQFHLLLWISVLLRRYVPLHFWGCVCLGNSFLPLVWRLQKWKASKKMLLVFLIGTKKQKQYFSAGFWSWRAWLFNRQRSVLCRLYFSPESKGAFVSRIQEGGEGVEEGIGGSAINRPTSHFPLPSMTAKAVPASRRGLNRSLPFATKIYNMWPTFTSTACPSLGMLFVAHWI